MGRASAGRREGKIGKGGKVGRDWLRIYVAGVPCDPGELGMAPDGATWLIAMFMPMAGGRWQEQTGRSAFSMVLKAVRRQLCSLFAVASAQHLLIQDTALHSIMLLTRLSPLFIVPFMAVAKLDCMPSCPSWQRLL